MARTASSFRQIDVARAVRAARVAGMDVKSIEIDPRTGKITISTAAAASGDQEKQDTRLMEAIRARKTSVRNPAR
jgi:hypothetical protein